VVSGTGMGRRLAFPTLNLAAEQELLPARGVYITRARLEGKTCSHRSVTNVGTRPTFNGSALSVETHLLDAQLKTAPQRMEVRFLEAPSRREEIQRPRRIVRADRPRYRERQ